MRSQLIRHSFIDMTSHELRNPLSAVVQCAESAIASVEQLRAHAEVEEEIDSTVDSLQTIVTCSLHQKRVIDDVLTLSKLDSDLILITPVKVQPAVVILEAMKMFDVECRQMDMTLEFREDKSDKEIDWVMLDPSRMLQVLINLLYVRYHTTVQRLLTS
jgi:signal transduction histidine kinase